MTMLERRGLLLGAAASLGSTRLARAQARDTTIRIAVLADFSGPYRDTSGPTAFACVQQAVADLDLAARGITVELIQGDHQNKPDVALAMSRQWIDTRGVDMICEVNNSAIALAVAGLVQEKNKIQVNTGALSAAITGERCSPTRCTGWRTPGCSPTRSAPPPCARAGTAGTSSPPTTPSATRWSAT
jgi:branched-chain amino acid transport system substrate-binding protein